MWRYELAPAPGADEDALLVRALELFPDGLEEERDADGRLRLAGYSAAPRSDLPATLGAWRGEEVADGWEERWRDFHHGIAVAGRLWVGPPWEAEEAGGLERVVIDPGRAFGTGAHPSTALCLELLCGLPAGGPLLDLGCGSGVLAIAAARLGYAPVLACDVDPLAVEVTARNAAVNGVAVETFVADATGDPLPAAPLWVANILAGPLAEIVARPDAPDRILVSGLLSDEPFAAPRHAVAGRVDRDGWQALALERVA